MQGQQGCEETMTLERTSVAGLLDGLTPVPRIILVVVASRTLVSTPKGKIKTTTEKITLVVRFVAIYVCVCQSVAACVVLCAFVPGPRQRYKVQSSELCTRAHITGISALDDEIQDRKRQSTSSYLLVLPSLCVTTVCRKCVTYTHYPTLYSNSWHLVCVSSFASACGVYTGIWNGYGFTV